MQRKCFCAFFAQFCADLGFFRAARLQNEVGTKDFSMHIFSPKKKLRNFARYFRAFILWVQEKVPQNSRQNGLQFASPKSKKKNHRRASAGAQGEGFSTGKEKAHKLKKILRTPATCSEFWDTQRDKQGSTRRCHVLLFSVEEVTGKGSFAGAPARCPRDTWPSWGFYGARQGGRTLKKACFCLLSAFSKAPS